MASIVAAAVPASMVASMVTAVFIAAVATVMAIMACQKSLLQCLLPWWLQQSLLCLVL
jgi:hypothetical protein